MEQRESKKSAVHAGEICGKAVAVARDLLVAGARVGWEGQRIGVERTGPLEYGYPRSVGVEMPLDRRAVAGRGVAGGPGQGCAAPAPLLRKSFGVDKEVASAYFYGTGLGYFELYMNGEKVGDDVLAPNQTNYGKRPGLESAESRSRIISGSTG